MSFSETESGSSQKALLNLLLSASFQGCGKSGYYLTSYAFSFLPSLECEDLNKDMDY